MITTIKFNSEGCAFTRNEPRPGLVLAGRNRILANILHAGESFVTRFSVVLHWQRAATRARECQELELKWVVELFRLLKLVALTIFHIVQSSRRISSLFEILHSSMQRFTGIRIPFNSMNAELMTRIIVLIFSMIRRGSGESRSATAE